MNVHERDQLLQFLSSLQRTAALPRDAVAEDLIRQKLAEGVSVYDLVQRGLALTLALEASQAHAAQLQTQLQAHFQSQRERQAAQASTAPLVPVGPLSAVPDSRSLPPEPPASLWSQGVLRQVGGTAVGVAAGVIAGGLLLEGWERLWGPGWSAAQDQDPADLGERWADAGADSGDLGDA